jgi:hypothetical protein
VGIEWNIAVFDVHRTDTLQIHSTARALGTDHDTFGRISQAAGEKVSTIQTTVKRRKATPSISPMKITPYTESIVLFLEVKSS